EPLLVLPTAADADHYLRELAAGGVAAGVRVERFDGLLAIAIERAAVAGQVLDGLAREQLIAALLARGRGGEAPDGVVRALAEAIAGLRERRISPEQLTRAAGGGLIVRRLARDYAAYARELARLGCVDREERAVRALDELRRRPSAWAGQPVLVYGFDDL